MKNNKILYISQEISPYLPESSLSKLGRFVPQYIQERGFEVRTFMPKYGIINERRNQLHEVIRLSGMNIVIDDTDHPLIIKVATLQPAKMQVYFIDNDDYFRHFPEKDLEIRLSPEDNDELVMFFARGVIETVKKLRWEPAIVHCTGWVTSLAPLYLKRMYHDDPSLSKAKIVYSLREEDFEGVLDVRFIDKLKMSQFTEEDLRLVASAPVDWLALNKLAIDYSDAVIQASETVDPRLVEYAKATGKPFLPYTAEDTLIDKYASFYNSLIAQE